jgi:hypothetical protein
VVNTGEIARLEGRVTKATKLRGPSPYSINLVIGIGLSEAANIRGRMSLS